MKKNWPLLLGILLSLALAVLAYFWVNDMMDSMYAYRSPLRYDPPVPGDSLGKPLTRRMVIVLVDALRVDTSLDGEVMPFLAELRQQSAWAAMHSRPPSYSEPGYTTLLTGAWPDINDGPPINLAYDEIPAFTQDDLFSAAHRAGLRTAISGYYWFEKLVPQAAVDKYFYTPGEDQLADRKVVDEALLWLDKGDVQLVLIHIDQVDYAGHHEGGLRDARWNEAASRADDLIREIAARLDLTQDTLLVVSDHGQIDQGGHGGQEAIVLLEPFILAGAGVLSGSYGDLQMVDVAPTMAALLGTNMPASSQGHPRIDMLDIPVERRAEVLDASAEQQGRLVSAYANAIQRKVEVSPSGDVVAASQQAMDEAHQSRLSGERLPRLLPAVVFLFIPFLVPMWEKAQKPLWFLAGGVLYGLLFNLRYAVLDNKTYSLSSVSSANSLIGYVALTGLIALVIAWLVTLMGTGGIKGGTRTAAESSLKLGWVTLYLLLIPVVVSYVLNGVLVTWTLPDPLSLFLGFISLIQVMIVAVLSVLLAGIAALAAGVVRRLRS